MVGPDDIPIEAWRCLGEMPVDFVTQMFNTVLECERMPEEWKRSVLVLIFKQRAHVQSCTVQISHSLMLSESSGGKVKKRDDDW